ncbi:MAG: hypothetical protein LBR79_03950 [Oscillospiraceae bacterium]|nr:hypothetical protein [Oscillospiraceae bacterium]
MQSHFLSDVFFNNLRFVRFTAKPGQQSKLVDDIFFPPLERGGKRKKFNYFET